MSDSIKMSANNTQVGGDHYKMQTMQHWDVVAMFDLDYFQGQITKYVFRWKKKGGLQDLKKALHFVQKYIELVEANIITDPMRSKAAENATIRHPIPTPTTPPFAGPGTLYELDGYGVQQSGAGYGGPVDHIPEQVSAAQVGPHDKYERDRFFKQNLPNLGAHLQRIQADGPPMGMSSGCDNYGRPMSDGKGRRESTSPAEQSGKSSTATAYDGDQYLPR